MPKQRRAWGRPKKKWMERIKKAMHKRNLNEGQWEDRKQRNLGVGQRRKTFWNRYTYIHTNCNWNELWMHIFRNPYVKPYASNTNCVTLTPTDTAGRYNGITEASCYITRTSLKKQKNCDRCSTYTEYINFIHTTSTFQRPAYTCTKTTPHIHFIYSGNKKIYWIFNTSYTMFYIPQNVYLIIFAFSVQTLWFS
jgi:hypothetical protein